MTLVNFTKKHRRRNGGIRLLGLIDQREVVSATYSELDKGFTELTLDEGASLSKFEFLEDGAEYRETIAAKDGAPTVAHELTFTLERMDADTAAAIEAIIEASRSGLIAVVVTINGDALLLGYSQEFGKVALCNYKISSTNKYKNMLADEYRVIADKIECVTVTH